MQRYRIRLAVTFAVSLSYLGCKTPPPSDGSQPASAAVQPAAAAAGLHGRGVAPDGAILLRPSGPNMEPHHSMKNNSKLDWYAHGQFYILFKPGAADPCKPDPANVVGGYDVYPAIQKSGNEYNAFCNVRSDADGTEYQYYYSTTRPTKQIGPKSIVPCPGCIVEIDDDQ